MHRSLLILFAIFLEANAMLEESSLQENQIYLYNEKNPIEGIIVDKNFATLSEIIKNFLQDNQSARKVPINQPYSMSTFKIFFDILQQSNVKEENLSSLENNVDSLKFPILVDLTNVSYSMYIKQDIQNVFIKKLSSVIDQDIVTDTDYKSFLKLDPKALEKIYPSYWKKYVQKIDPYFIFEEGTSQGIILDAEIAKESSTVKDMIGDLGEQPGLELPLPYKIATIKVSFDILKNFYKSRMHNKAIEEGLIWTNLKPSPSEAVDTIISKLSPDQLIDAINCAWRLHMSIPIDVFTKEIRSMVSSNSFNTSDYQRLQKINPDLAQSELNFFAARIRKQIIEKAVKKPKHTSVIPLIHEAKVISIASSDDNQMIALGCSGQDHNLILCNIRDNFSIQQIDLAGHSFDVQCVAFSPDNTMMVSGSDNNLIVWDLSNRDKPQEKFFLQEHSSPVRSVIFSKDNKHIVSISNGSNNCIVWSTENGELIAKHTIDGFIYQILFDSKNKKYKIFSGKDELGRNFLLETLMQSDFSINQKAFRIRLKDDWLSRELQVMTHGHTLILLKETELYIDKRFLIYKSEPNTFIRSATLSNDDNMIIVTISDQINNRNDLLLLDITTMNILRYEPDSIEKIKLNNPAPISISTMIFSADDSSFIIGGDNAFAVWTLLTNKENAATKKLLQSNLAQIALVTMLFNKYQVYKASVSLTPADFSVFVTLHQSIKDWLFESKIITKKDIELYSKKRKKTTRHVVQAKRWFETLPPEKRELYTPKSKNILQRFLNWIHTNTSKVESLFN